MKGPAGQLRRSRASFLHAAQPSSFPFRAFSLQFAAGVVKYKNPLSFLERDMSKIKSLVCLLLALCMLLPGLPAALAEEPEATPEPEENILEDERFVGKSWDEVMEDFLQSWGTDEKNVGIGYYNTVTGEEHYVNADQYMVSASMYKVPLNMVFLDRLTKGEMDWDTNISGYSYEVVLEQTIVHSNNDIARNMVRWELGKGKWQEGRRYLAPYCGLDPETVDWKFLENNYSTPRQMIACLRLLYENPDRFPRLIETMQRAEPEEYFKRRERRFNIAHKYGFLTTEYHLYMNDCGICFTDEPILIVLFTDNVNKAYDVMTEFCTLMCDYAQYHHALRLQEEAAEAERRRQEEEAEAERRRQEEERQAREPAETSPVVPPNGQTPTPPVGQTGESRTPPETQAQEPSEEQSGVGKTALIAGAVTLAAGLAAALVLAGIGKKYRLRSRVPVLLALLLSLGCLVRIGWPAWQQLRDKPSGNPQDTVTTFFDALARQDYEAACACLDGVESLGLEYLPALQSDQAILAAMRGQFSAELYGDCSVDGETAYQQVNCRYFDLEKLEGEAKTQALLNISRYVSTHPVGDLYDESGRYRPELLRDAWDEAVAELLQQPENYQSSGGVQLELRWHEGGWRIVPNEKLLQLLCGGVQLTEKGGEA